MFGNLTVITDKQRNHCIKRFLLLTISMVFVFQTSIANQPAVDQSSPGKKFTVTIDSGHGGHDTGAPGKKSLEKNIALEIALKLGYYMESLMDDVDVYYTRKTDVFIPLYERAQIANQNKSDLFISIHVNANKKSAPSGTSTYVMGFSRSKENLDLVKQENKAIFLEKDYQTRYAGFDPTSDESYILFNIVQNNNLTQSLEIATAVQDQLRIHGQRKDIGVHQGNLVVLWGCAKPSVLIETGFISNPQEEAFLMTKDGQDIIASSIYAAFREYKESVDAKISDLAKTVVTKPEINKKSGEIDENMIAAKKKTEDTLNKEKKSKEGPLIEQVKVVSNPVDSTPSLGSGPECEYRVQVLASEKRLPVNAKEFKGAKGLIEYKKDGFYKYMSKSVDTYQKALELRRQLGVSFKGAFIVAFKNGERVPLNVNTEKKEN